ncbi:MAG: type II secretion system protein GspK [Amphiplicatus sp.]
MNGDARASAKRHAQKGAALLIVLWTALLLSALTAGAIASARIEARIAAARTQRFLGEQALRSALDYAAWSVAVGEARPDGDAIVENFALNGFAVTVEPSAESRKLDINLASEEIWAEALGEAGAEPEEAQIYAARIADWRDEDDLVRPNGAEGREYRVKNLKIGNRDFYSVGELHNIIGLPPALVHCLTPSLTLFASGEAAADADAEVSDASDRQMVPAALGTASRASAAGRSFAVEAAATSEGDALAPLRLAGAFRVLGGSEAIFQWVSRFGHSDADKHCPPDLAQSL